MLKYIRKHDGVVVKACLVKDAYDAFTLAKHVSVVRPAVFGDRAYYAEDPVRIVIPTPGGDMTVSIGDYLIEGPDRNFYFMHPPRFKRDFGLMAQGGF